MRVGTSVLASYKGISAVESATREKTKEIETSTHRTRYRRAFEQENGQGEILMRFGTSVLASYKGISDVEKEKVQNSHGTHRGTGKVST